MVHTAHLECLREAGALGLVHLRRFPGIDEGDVRPPLTGVAALLAGLELRLGLLLISQSSILLLADSTEARGKRQTTFSLGIIRTAYCFSRKTRQTRP